MTKKSTDWMTMRLGDVCDVLTGGTPRTDTSEYWNGDINWMSSGEVNKRRVKNVDKRITTIGLDNSNARILPKDTIMIALAGQGKTRGKVAILEIETTCNQSLAGVIVRDKSVIDQEFLFQSLDRSYLELRGLSGGEGRSGLNLTLIKNFKVSLPTITSQKVYADILRTVDRSIEASEQIIHKSQILKKGLLQNLFPKTSNRGRVVKFEDLFSTPLKNGLNRPTKVRGNGVKMVNMGELFKYPKIVDQEMELVPLSQNEWNYLLKNGDLLFARQSLVREGAGKCSIYLGANDIVTYEGHIIRVRLNNTYANPLYFFYFFQSPLGRSKIEQLITHSAAAGIKGSELAKLQISLPSLQEQTEIALTLSAVDEKIEYEQNLRNKFIALKKGLMNDIFNQRISIN